MHHALLVEESPEVRDKLGPAPTRVAMRTFTVVRHLFKRGRTFSPGDPIDLDPKTALSFLEAGDIKEKPE